MTKAKTDDIHNKMVQIREFISKEDLLPALELCQGLPNQGIHARAIKSAWTAYVNPDFYRVKNKDPQAILIKGLGCMRKLYS